MTTPRIEEWEKEFNETFGVFFNLMGEYHIDMDEAIKAFILAIGNGVTLQAEALMN